MTRWLGCLLLLCAACGAEERGLVVDVRTDLLPGVEFAFVRTTAYRGVASTEEAEPELSTEVVALTSQDWMGGRRVAEWDGLDADRGGSGSRRATPPGR